MNYLDGITEARALIAGIRNQHAAALPEKTLEHLTRIEQQPIPPVWCVEGMEALWAAYDALPQAAKDACAVLAEATHRHQFYGKGERAYAIWQTIVGDDPTVTAPEADPEFSPEAAV